MNNVLELKGKRFVQASKSGNGGGINMNSKVVVTSQHIKKLAEKLQDIYAFWSNEKKLFNGVLISTYYNKIVAKTNRISGLFKGNDSNYYIVGAKFNEDKSKHIITYFLSTDDIIRSINLLYDTDEILSAFFKQGMTKDDFDNDIIINKIDFTKYKLPKTTFKQIIADVSYVDNFEVELASRKKRKYYNFV